MSHARPLQEQTAYYASYAELPNVAETALLAERVYSQVFRTRFDAPGFALVSLGTRGPVSSQELRHWMVQLKEALGDRYSRNTRRFLVYRAMGRFDQQATTKFHLDGAPDESFLMLGYEPSEVESEVWMADYSRAAFDLGMTPKQFIAEFNPMFAHGEQQIRAYRTRLEGFEPQYSNILVINNCCLEYGDGAADFQGVMHQATIAAPQPEKRRIINSTMLFSVLRREDAPLPLEVQQEFIRTDRISGELGRP